jgi:8-oxo-dGTP pyrophosphatase MutT (NUDIX family)
MKLRTHAGDVALPGGIGSLYRTFLMEGKADEDEDVWTTARREAWEEIGLPENIAPPYNVEHLCRLRPHLSRHHLLVTPVVAYLSSSLPETHDPNKLVPYLDTEVSSLFSIPFEQFLRSTGREDGVRDWRHESRQIKWLGAEWIFHDFFATVVAWVKPEAVDAKEDTSPVPTEVLTRIWGLTARILIDACIIGYGRMPEFKHTEDLWDEKRIDAIVKFEPKMRSVIGKEQGVGFKRRYKL